MSKAFDDFHLLSSKERAFILNDDQVLEDLVKTNLKESRFLHSLSVAKTCAELAVANGVDVNKAYRAGLLHDVTKYLSEEEQDLYLKCYDPDKLHMPAGVKHSYTAVYYLKEKLNYHDSDILNAIYNHTICESSDKLSMILYIADKREPLRQINDGILDRAFYDLKGAFKELQIDVDEYLKKEGKK